MSFDCSFVEKWYLEAHEKKKDTKNLKQEIVCDEHTLPLDQLAVKLKTDYKNGLTPEEARDRLAINGLNQLTPPVTVPEWIKIIKQLFSGFAILLWFGAILCLIAFAIDKNRDNIYLALVLIFVVLFTGGFTYFQEAKSSSIMESFQKMVPHFAMVIRNGHLLEINATELVIGDIVEIKGGDQIPADVRIIEAKGCKVDNSSLTGESEPQLRLPEESSPLYIESKNVAFFSTNCVEGRGKGIVIRCGDDTLMGKIANLTALIENRQTPLSKEIDHFISLITIFAFSVATFMAVLALIVGNNFVETVVFFISLIVANVPEGLLATVTVCLTLTAKRMARKNCLVKHLEAVETLGSTSTICSDKTGTLTQNRMTVSHLWVGKKVYEADMFEKRRADLNDIKNMTDFQKAALVCCLCCNAVFKAHQERIPIQKRLTIGDASESAILKFMEKTIIKNNVAGVRQLYPKVFEIPFNSSNKFHLTIHRVNLENSNYLLFMKGAPERILERSSSFIQNDKVWPTSPSFEKAFNNAYKALGGLGERVLGLSFLPLPKDKFPLDFVFSDSSKDKNVPMDGLTFIGLISMIDPPKPGVLNAVKKCQEAGIQVVMVTGDHPITAQAIAKSVNIITKRSHIFEINESENINKISLDNLTGQINATVITGSQIKDLGDDGLDKMISKFDEIVFARTSPQQKLSIVEAFQRKGEVVAVTGDGVNDSPALKKGDIGIAMGISGSDVSKQAADMILLDDNFSSIVVGVEEGRIIFDNLKKSIAYCLTSNTPEIMPFLLYIIIGIPLPLGVITILCIDMGTDILPAISLGYEPAESDIMQRKPRTARDQLVNDRLLGMALGQIGGIQSGAGFLAYYIIMAHHGFHMKMLYNIRERWNSKCTVIEDHYGQEWSYDARKQLEYTCQSAFFVAIVVTQWFDLFICKTRRNSIIHQGFSNEVLNFALIFETAVTLFLCYTPGVKYVLKIQPLLPSWWAYGVPFGCYLWIYDECRRFLLRRFPGGFVELETYY